MKKLLFIVFSTGIISVISEPVRAQTSLNNMRFPDGVGEKKSLSFIENIEINHGSIASMTGNSNIPGRLSGIEGNYSNRDISSSIESCSPLQFKYAQLMNREVESISNLVLYNFIDDWWGTDYRFGGTNRSGIDCSAYAGTLMSRVYGLNAPRTSIDQYKVCEKLGRDELKEGDLVFFKTRRRISHVGIYLGNGYFTHSSISNGVTISSLDETYYNSKFIAGGRIKPVCSE